ncbi:putative receptor-like protein kinase At5g39000 [Durio zibethinus]|uniref:Pathogenesis-related protein 1 n=1 Tax=Durio zibethinus TaxID=66656 RepID=A0A6P6ABJ1_DURZI|nr:putative receptor-like protein kinase At5g39000 [Durio zibethinus]
MELRNISLTFCFFGLALFLRMGTQGSASISGRMLSYSATNQTYPQDQGFLTVHNAARKEVDVPPMTWNYTVAAYAESYAYQRSTDCSLVHSGGPYGENLAWSIGNLSVSEAVNMWIDEKSNYDLESGWCDLGQECGHYFQVIWPNSIRLGCAKVGCDNGGTFIVCNYDPPANITGDLPTVAIQSESAHVTVVASPSPSSAAESSFNQSQDSPLDYLNVHNAARAAVGVRPMTWDNVVAAYALNYSDQRSGDCNLVPSGGPYGENLAGSSGNLSGSEAVGMWINEKVYYDWKSNACAPGQICGHYTQVIWANSIRLGCAKVRCYNGGTFVSCNYDPPGNIIGKRPTDGNQSIIEAVEPSPDSAPHIFPLKEGKDRKGLVVGLIVGACALILGLGFIWFVLSRGKKQEDKIDDHISDVFFGGEFQNGMAPRKFSLVELAKVTSNFKGEKLGDGGFGAVYKGYLRDLDAEVAVKRISKASKQGIKEYASEVKIISRLRHKNLVKLIGWCHEKGELILVYEFMANGSLDSHLFKGKSLLTWVVRFKIVQDLSSALFYLHEEGDHCVLHRDIKTSNILLDSSFNAKLGDFGLARLVDHAKGSQTTHLAGTLGYMAPECVSSGKASKKSDVYSFGIVALELACGRRSIEPKYEESQASLVAWVWDSYGNQRLLDVADQKLRLDFDAKQMECLLMVGLWCVHPDQNLRPSIRQAIQVLNFEAPLPKLPSTRPTPTYDVPMASGNRASEPCFSTLSITVPR